ncbi:MAG: HEAT repeat domain-containing protein [Planctomycetes bacterium]|nr:HEAT repeat domain-containing protein [Planctomycetota bacterium]
MRLLHVLPVSLVALAFTAPNLAQDKKPLRVPDLTAGEPIPAGHEHDWNLGPTGARGWMFCDRMVTTDARQIAITKVAAGSPADGVLAVGDVLLGAGGAPFARDPRTELGMAITAAESKAGGGALRLSRWRGGASTEVTVKLPTQGDYSATAPFDCRKSEQLFARGVAALAAQMADPKYGRRLDPIPRSLNALALLASGDGKHRPVLQREARWAADYRSDSMQTWHYGYVMIFLAEHVLATGDRDALAGLRRLAMEAAKGQSAVGSWGHGFARPDGRLGGYGMMNSPGLPLTIGLVLARQAGVDDPQVADAIERSAKLLRFYVGKGAVPYGDHHPWIETHEDNGKCGMAATLFDLMGEADAATFFSRMSVASHGAERDTGHTGNYFNVLWALPGVARSGPQATGAWMRAYGGWYADLARRWDGTFAHQGPPEPKPDSYDDWNATGGWLLALGLPRRSLLLTGKRASTAAQLSANDAEALIADGRGWDNKDRKSAYDARSDAELLANLSSWSPVVRERAAMALGRRRAPVVDALVAMLDAKEPHARLGACQALGELRGRGAPAVDALRRTLAADDLWLRVKAAEALAAIGKPAAAAVPQLLAMMTQLDPQRDPRAMQQRYLTFALFDRDGMLGKSLDGVDPEALYVAVRAGLQNQDGRARSNIVSVYRNLSADAVRPLLPAILRAVVEPAPSGEMFADGIRVEGLRVLAKNRIEEGIAALAQYARHQNPWDSQDRTPELMTILLQYGGRAKVALPELRALAEYFDKEEKDFPRNLSIKKVESVRATIAAIEAATEMPELVRLKAQ